MSSESIQNPETNAPVPNAEPSLLEKSLRARERVDSLLNNKYIKAAKRARAIYVFVTASPLLVTGLIIIVLLFFVSSIIANPGLDSLSLAFQCNSIESAVNEDCINQLKDRFREKIRSDEEDVCGSITNPCPTTFQGQV